MIPLEQVKQHLRIVDDVEDAYLCALIPAAIRLFESETGRNLVMPRELPKVVTNEIELDDLINMGILLTIGHWFENREATSTASVKSIPLGVRACWQPYRLFNI